MYNLRRLFTVICIKEPQPDGQQILEELGSQINKENV